MRAAMLCGILISFVEFLDYVPNAVLVCIITCNVERVDWLGKPNFRSEISYLDSYCSGLSRLESNFG